MVICDCSFWKTILIRRYIKTIEPSSLAVGDLSIDLLKREIYRSGKKIELQPREYTLLEYLMRNADRVLSKTMVLEHVWDFHFHPQTNVADVLVVISHLDDLLKIKA
jgi:DNA-binding response OmpR family regulator